MAGKSNVQPKYLHKNKYVGFSYQFFYLRLKQDIHLISDGKEYYFSHFRSFLVVSFTENSSNKFWSRSFQVYPEYPQKDEFFKKCVQVTGRAGDMMLFPGIIQHAAMPNKSNTSRTGVIIQVSNKNLPDPAGIDFGCKFQIKQNLELHISGNQQKKKNNTQTQAAGHVTESVNCAVPNWPNDLTPSRLLYLLRVHVNILIP